MSREKTKKGAGKPVPLMVPDEMDKRVKAAAKLSGLSQADIMRLAIDRGLQAVEKMFETPDKQAA